ncbi:DUF6378 domain-containing protein [Paenibacillus alvei]|uniref:DUF6378 domain-containing protein n=1 Tax=Paenibacillus alvei TaxID=44250 RepID=UPI002282954D|nr:DUF6378 domain-containing protein [Paenibacillus alvei]
MKFKVGQRVTVNVEGVKVGGHSNGVRFNSNMSKYHGETFEVNCLPYDNNEVRLFGNPYVWSPEWLVLADGEQPDGQWGYKGELYRVLDRAVEKGELMLVVKPCLCSGEDMLKVNDVLECCGAYMGSGYYGEKLTQFLDRSEYKVLVPAADDKPTQDVADEPKQEPVTPYGVLEAARKHMLDRAATYDSPDGERSMKATVQAFNAIHGTELTEAQGWTFMTLLKLVRTAQREAYHADSYEDAAAYVGLAAEAKAKESAI